MLLLYLRHASVFALHSAQQYTSSHYRMREATLVTSELTLSIHRVNKRTKTVTISLLLFASQTIVTVLINIIGSK